MSLTHTNLIPLTSVEEEFDKHIQPEINKRILFSARFGAGKSTFLNQYFENHDDEYIVLKLYPVNYSVASNEDVFELIKYDLFSELLAKYADKLDFDEEDFSTLLIGQSYLLHDFKVYPFVKALLKAAIPNGDAIEEVVAAAKGIYDGFKSYQEKVQRKDADVIEDYIKWCEQRKGSIYERDEITSLLSDLILRVKSKNDNKPVVLIVDDLDRLDPEHVFRLFNVFSAHYDATTDVNKFGLDKVIFVCDYDNISLMYSHRYGEGVDFEGYINKFFSINVFHFDIVRHLTESVEQLLLSRPSNINPRFSNKYGVFGSSNYIVKSLVLVIRDLVKNKFITFRSIDQFKEFRIPEYEVKIDDTTFYANQFYFVTFINLLTQSITLNSLIIAIEALADSSSSFSVKEYQYRNENYYYWLVDQSLICFLTGRQLQGYDDEKVLNLKLVDQDYQINMIYSHESELMNPRLDVSGDKKFNALRILAEAIKAGRRRNMFK